MKKPIIVALFSTIASIILHLLLTIHYYPLRFGFSNEKSSCSLNSVFDCDAVSTSEFASFLGVPLALWGVITNVLLLMLILGLLLKFAEEMGRLLRVSTYLSIFIASMSILMGLISATQLNTYCIYCLGTYITSLISLIALHRSNEPGYLSYFTTDLQSFFQGQKVYIIFLLLIPALSFFSHKSIVNFYGASKIDLVVQNSINQWKSNKLYTFSASPSLSKGSFKSFMTITEFADFQCGHCRKAALPLSSFTRSHKDIKLNFMAFPLDGNCNNAIKQKRGTSCRLAKSTFCANQQSSAFGWTFHDSIFADQGRFPVSGSKDKIDEILKEIIKLKNLDWKKLTTCMESEEAHEAILAQAQAGKDAQVQGTPSIYVNGRLLPRAQLIPVLEGVYKDLKSK